MNNISSISSMLSSILGVNNTSDTKSNSVSSLFTSLNTTNSVNASELFSGVNLSDYSSIKRGSYYKLLKKYYSSETVTTDASAVVAKNKTTLNSAGNVVSSVNELKNTSFSTEDREKLISKVSDFVKEYNSMISSANSSDSKNIMQKAKWLSNMTKEYASMLSDAGISVGSDSRLTLDKEALQKADSTTLKDLFSGTGSYANKVLYKAEQIYSLAMTGGSSTTAYTSKANYKPTVNSSFNTTT